MEQSIQREIICVFTSWFSRNLLKKYQYQLLEIKIYYVRSTSKTSLFPIQEYLKYCIPGCQGKHFMEIKQFLELVFIVIAYVMLYLSITYINKKITVTSHYVFWCAWESTDKNLPKSQLDVEILIFDIIYSL